MAELKTYRALARGYDGDKIREEGDVFTTAIPKGSWMEEIDAKTGAAIEAAEIAASQTERAALRAAKDGK